MKEAGSKTQEWTAYTKHKVGFFGLVINYTLSVLPASHKTPFFVFDLNAGCGTNCNGRWKGSPFVALDALRRHKPAAGYRAWYIDKNKKTARCLESRLHGSGTLFPPSGPVKEINVLCVDNEDFSARIPQIISDHGANPAEIYGVVISDPNGIKCPLRNLAKLSHAVPGLTMLFHIDAGAMKRVRGYEQTHPGWLKERHNRVLYLADIFHNVSRRRWLIMGRAQGSRSQHVTIAGSNLPRFPDHERMGVHYLNSAEGLAIVIQYDGRRP